MSTQIENDPTLGFDSSYFQNNLPHYYRSTLQRFRKISRSFVRFNLLSMAVIALELAALIFFLPFLSKSSILAYALGALFLTVFSYLLFLFYFQAKKPEQIHQLREDFLHSCRQILPIPPSLAEHHLSIADALTKLSNYLQDFEWNFYKAPQFLTPFISRFSAYCYWEDVFQLKQLLFQAAIDEHLKQIRSTPTDLEVHASLATAYVSLSGLYKNPITHSHPKSRRARTFKELFDEKAATYSKLAIEEFKILSHYAPNDPWVHEQLSQGYRALGMPEEEIREVELLLKLRPLDKEILFRLGALYFRQGMNARGLQIYDELKQANFKQAEDLISSYGSSSGLMHKD